MKGLDNLLSIFLPGVLPALLGFAIGYRCQIGMQTEAIIWLVLGWFVASCLDYVFFKSNRPGVK